MISLITQTLASLAVALNVNASSLTVYTTPVAGNYYIEKNYGNVTVGYEVNRAYGNGFYVLGDDPDTEAVETDAVNRVNNPSGKALAVIKRLGGTVYEDGSVSFKVILPDPKPTPKPYTVTL